MRKKSYCSKCEYLILLKLTKHKKLEVSFEKDPAHGDHKCIFNIHIPLKIYSYLFKQRQIVQSPTSIILLSKSTSNEENKLSKLHWKNKLSINLIFYFRRSGLRLLTENGLVSLPSISHNYSQVWNFHVKAFNDLLFKSRDKSF